MFQSTRHWCVALAGSICVVAANAAPMPSAPARDQELVDEAVHAWAASWDRGDVPQYLSHYADNFVPAGGLTRQQWEQQRRMRLKITAIRHVMLRDVQVDVSADTARARFTQHYLDLDQMSTARKRLTLVKQSGEWKIREEQVETERLVRR
ncbi:MAG: yrrB [Rhodocyclales bacterium]|nr:yrrB [Rhodocyclales bacterium]